MRLAAVPLQLTPDAKCHSTSGVTLWGLRTLLRGMGGSTHPSFLLQLHQKEIQGREETLRGTPKAHIPLVSAHPWVLLLGASHWGQEDM